MSHLSNEQEIGGSWGCRSLRMKPPKPTTEKGFWAVLGAIFSIFGSCFHIFQVRPTSMFRQCFTPISSQAGTLAVKGSHSRQPVDRRFASFNGCSGASSFWQFIGRETAQQHQLRAGHARSFWSARAQWRYERPFAAGTTPSIRSQCYDNGQPADERCHPILHQQFVDTCSF